MAQHTPPTDSAPSALVADPSDEQTRALRALELAARLADDLARFATVASILADESAGEHDDVLAAIEEIAEAHYDGGLDFDEAFEERFSQTIKKTDPRYGELYDLHVQECHAQQLAGFALGVAWGRLGAR